MTHAGDSQAGLPRAARPTATSVGIRDSGAAEPQGDRCPPPPQGALCLLKQSLCQGRCAHLGQVPWAQNGRTRGPRACQPRSLPLSSRGGRSVGAPGRSPGRPFPEDPRRRSGPQAGLRHRHQPALHRAPPRARRAQAGPDATSSAQRATAPQRDDPNTSSRQSPVYRERPEQAKQLGISKN